MTLRQLMKRFASVKSNDSDTEDTDMESDLAQENVHLNQVPEIEPQEEPSGANELQYFPHQQNHQETQNHLYHQYGHHHQIFLLSSISQQGTQSYYNLHPAVRTTAYIAMFFKVGSIALAVLSVLALSYLGIMISWGLAFGLPWILAYFYFIWICPSHQLSMGIRKLKPHRMLWFVVSSIVHIILAAILLVLYTLLPPSIPPGLSIADDHQMNYIIGLASIIFILVSFQAVVIWAIFIIQRERRRVQANTSSLNSQTVPRYSQDIPPPSYEEVFSDNKEPLPPTYEDICHPTAPKEDTNEDENEDTTDHVGMVGLGLIESNQQEVSSS